MCVTMVCVWLEKGTVTKKTGGKLVWGPISPLLPTPTSCMKVMRDSWDVNALERSISSLERMAETTHSEESARTLPGCLSRLRSPDAEGQAPLSLLCPQTPGQTGEGPLWGNWASQWKKYTIYGDPGASHDSIVTLQWDPHHRLSTSRELPITFHVPLNQRQLRWGDTRGKALRSKAKHTEEQAGEAGRGSGGGEGKGEQDQEKEGGREEAEGEEEEEQKKSWDRTFQDNDILADKTLYTWHRNVLWGNMNRLLQLKIGKIQYMS